MPEMPDGSFEVDNEFVQPFIKYYPNRAFVLEPVNPIDREAILGEPMVPFPEDEARRRYPKLFAHNSRPLRLGLNQKDYRAWDPTPMDPGMEPTLEQVVFEVLGLAATCWSDLSSAGRFESENLSALSERLVEVLRERGAS
jgi:hypothetical protein